MKKTLLAMGLAASAVSGMANAWTTGDFNGSVDIGGTITPDNYKNNWQWKVGTGLNAFNNAVSSMTKSATELSIPVTGDQPLVMGQTTKAFSTPATGMGAVPVLGYKDSDGVVVSINDAETADHDGKVFFTLPIKDDTGTKIGSLRVDATVAGLTMGANGTQLDISAVYAGSGNSIFSNGIPGGSSQVKSSTTASSVSTLFGNLSLAEMATQVQLVAPAAINYHRFGDAAAFNMVTGNWGLSVVSATYTLGMKSGQTLTATFDKPVTTSTKWSAPLNVTVSYL